MTAASQVLKKLDEAWPRGGEADEAAARELSLFAVNHGELHRQRITPIIDNLNRKVKRGVYDHSKALKLWGYAADDAAQRYGKEIGGGGQPGPTVGGFNKATRMRAAQHIQDHYDDAIAAHPH